MVVIEIEKLRISHSYDRLLDVGIKLICDKIVKLGSKYSYQTTQGCHIIKIVDKTGKELTFITNIDDPFSEKITFLYKKT